MTIALELRGIRKRFIVGAGTCRASADVLRGVDLAVHAGESVVIVGPAGSGKSTLMLCAAGLLTPEAGELAWFGDPSRALAARRVLYHCTPTDLIRSGCAHETHVHLVDVSSAADGGTAAAAWIEQRCDRGDAVVVTSRDAVSARRLGMRTLALRGGQLNPVLSARARVAEHAPV